MHFLFGDPWEMEGDCDESIATKEESQPSLETLEGNCDESIAPKEPYWDCDEWTKRGEAIAKSYRISNWEIGDWLLEGEFHIPTWDSRDIPRQKRKWWAPPSESSVPSSWDVYYEAEQITGLTRSHLRDLASTARRMPRSVRTDALTWSHHRTLINLLPNAEEAELKKWIDEAVEKRYTVAQFEKALRPKSLVKEPIKSKSFIVTVPLRAYESLHDIARGQESTVQKVASNLLTEQLDTPEMQGARQAYKAEAEFRLKERRRQVGRRVARAYDPLGLQR